MLLDRQGPLVIRANVLPQLLGGWAWRFAKACRPADFARGSAALGGLMDHAMSDWRRLLAGTPAEHRLTAGGHHVVWQSPNPSADIAAALADAKAQNIPVRVWGTDDWPRLPEAVRARIGGGMTYLASGHVSDPYQIVAGLHAAFIAAGGRDVRQKIAALQPSGAGWRADDLDVARVVVATGIDAGTLLAPLGYQVPLIAERGYHVAVARNDAGFDAPIIFQERGFIVTPMEGFIRATTTTEFSHRDAAPNPKRPEILRNHLRASGLLSAEEQSSDWMGNRPTLPDYLPAIGASRRHGGLYFAFGHQHLGLTLAASTARLILGAMTGGAAASPDFALERF
jgi:D-amino-acid dehydrogenase